MKIEEVYSFVDDPKIQDHIEFSLVWLHAYTKDEMMQVDNLNLTWYKYTVKFSGLTPVQVTNIEKI